MRHPIAACVLLLLLMCSQAHAERVGDTNFSIDRGFYGAPISVSISSATPGAFISYTTDGSAPHASGGGPSPVTVAIDQSLPLRAMAYLPGGEMEPTNIDTQTYVILSNPMRWSGKTYTSSPAYPPAVIESLQSLPALFISMAPSDFATVRDSGTGGIGQSGGNEQYERPCSAELWYPANSRFQGFVGFQIDAGLRPHSWVTTKRAFRLYFKRQYGSGKLRYPVFESAPWNGESAVEEFDKLMLRHHSNDGWEGRWGGADEALYLRDQFARSCQIDMGGPGTRSTWAHLFVNGAYYGLYNPTERPDDDFLASYLGGDDSDYLGFNHGGVINDGADETIYNAYRNPGDLSGAAAYTAFQDVLDPAQFSDYLVSSWFNTTHSHDWPVNGTRPQNFYGGNRNTPAAGTMHFTWDFEAALVWDSVVHQKFRRGSPDAEREFIKTWFALVENDKFMGLFADRAYRHLFNGGALTNTSSRQRLDAMAAHVQPALEAEKWQWGGEHDNWLSQLSAARAKLVTNPGNLINSLRSESYYPPIDPPHFKIGAGEITSDRLRTAAGTEIVLENSNGTAGEIRYTLDGTDPNEAGASGGGDSHSLTITTSTLIMARVVDGDTTSALRELLVIVPQDLSALRLSEVMYHPAPQLAVGEVGVLNVVGDADLGRAGIDLASPPPGDIRGGDSIRLTGGLAGNAGTFEIADVEGSRIFIRASLADDASGLAVADLLYDGDRFEFVEVENSGGSPLHLGAVEFSKGINFSFAPNFSLAAGARAVIATRPWDFARRYPAVQVAGEFLRDLSNGGETIELAQTDRARHRVSSLSPSGEISFASLPPGAVAGNRIRITGCERVTNNGSYRILAVSGNVVTVGKAFVAAPDGAYAQLFEVIDAVDYDDSGAWPRAADGLGYSLVSDGIGWRASSLPGGSPGAGDPPPPVHPQLMINEALTHTDLPQVDAVEIHNPTTAPVTLAGWSLTDDLDEPAKFQFQSGSIAAGGFAVFDESDFGSAFRLGADGDSIHLLSPDLRYSHGFEFGATENGVSLGRYLTSTGEEHFVRQASNSLGAHNTGPKVGPIIISEIHYHPDTTGSEFLELVNISPSPVSLDGWSVGGIGFDFPPGITMAPGEVLLLVESPAAAATAPAGVRKFTFTGKLSNGGERLRLRDPDQVSVDEVSYDDASPWPTAADGSGSSLERITNSAYANDPVNWRASSQAGGTPGASLPPTTPLIAFEPGLIEVSVLEGSAATTTSFELWNAGISTLNYSLAETADWLSVTPASGSSLNGANRTSHMLRLDPSELAPGTHNTQITITGNADNSPATLPVTLTIRERDLTPPILLSARATGGSGVAATFSEPVLGGAELPGNYTLSGGVTVLSATLDAAGTAVDLVTTAMVPATVYTLTASEIYDRAEIPNQIQASGGAPFFYAGSSLPDNLVARWSFDEGAGTTAEDGEGGNTLSLQQSPGWAVGNEGTALDLDGSSQFGSRGDPQLVGAFPSMSTGGATEFTLAAWVYLNRTGHRHPMMTKQGNETRGILWSVDENNRMNLQLFKNQSTSSDTASNSTLAANRWYHLAVTYSFAGDGNSRVRLYIDGSPSGGSDSAVGPPAPNAVDLNIGRYWWSSSYSTFFDGRIDDFMIWDRELDPGEISQVHSGVAATVARPDISPPGGEFVNPVEVDLTSATGGAEIFFTLDGSEPTAGSTRFTAPLLISESTTVRARAFAAGMIPSDSTTSTFTRIEASGDWWITRLPLRRLCTVAAGDYPRTDLHCAVIPIDLGDAVADSLRVVEINAGGIVIDPSVRFQYDGADSELILVLDGATAAGSTRYYHVYYATAGDHSPAALSPLVVVDPDSSDGGFDSLRFATPSGTWQYHKVGAGFSSLDDIDGNDWIGWSTANGSDGAYRGIPNLAYNSGYFHPGGQGNPSTTTLATLGPVRSTLTSISEDEKWELRWDIYPAYAQLNVVRRDPAETYWFLYEGTPGGAIDLADDYSVRPDGTRLPLGTAWTGDLPGEEWVYVEDSALDRSIFVVQHQPDNNTDSYWQLNGDMTVLGFGRLNLNTYLSDSPNVFTVGLADGAAFSSMKQVIESAYRPLSVTSGLPETIPAEASYLAWAREKFGVSQVENLDLELGLWGMEADPDGDGISNALEQVTALDPLFSDGAGAFRVEAADSSFVFRYRLARDTAGWRITPQFSEDFVDWTNFPSSPSLHAELIDAQIWEVALPEADERIFARLRAAP